MKTHIQMQDTSNINNTISFIGLGKLGLPLATIFASGSEVNLAIEVSHKLATENIY